MFSSTNLSNALRAIASALQRPVIIFLLFLIAVTLIMAGTLIAELFTERLHMKAKLPELINKIKKKEQPLEEIINDSGLLKRQKTALITIVNQTQLAPLMRESLAADLLFEEKNHYELRVKITDLIMRLGPMCGLLGTLIPLGPGIIALGQGDTYTLSMSLLTAFDTTIAGLISAAVATIISAVRKQWYNKYFTALETVMECLLEVMNNEKE
jgi:biopolymer transport protein ExbB/TolQ